MAEDFDILGLECLQETSAEERSNFIHLNSALYDCMIVKSYAEGRHKANIVDSNTAYSFEASINHTKTLPYVKEKIATIRSIEKYKLLCITMCVFIIMNATNMALFIHSNYHNIQTSNLIAQKPDLVKEFHNSIPLILDFSSSNTLLSSNILSECLHLKSVSIEKYQVKCIHLFDLL